MNYCDCKLGLATAIRERGSAANLVDGKLYINFNVNDLSSFINLMANCILMVGPFKKIPGFRKICPRV